ncbi:MAG: hypothetical protein ACREX3_02820 [Gammaproteobacteria bacterium]
MRFLSAAAQVAGPQALADTVEEAGPRRLGRAALAERPHREASTAARQRRVLGWDACLHNGHQQMSCMIGQHTGSAGRSASRRWDNAGRLAHIGRRQLQAALIQRDQPT